MNKIKLELSVEERKVLLAFLDRVTLKGNEVQAFLQVKQALLNEIKEKPKEKKEVKE